MVEIGGRSCSLQYRKAYFMNVWEWDGDEYLKMILGGGGKQPFQWKRSRGKGKLGYVISLLAY